MKIQIRHYLIYVLTFTAGLSGCKNNQVNHAEKPCIEFINSGSVSVKDNFWAPIIKRNRLVTIPYAFLKCEETGRINNFAVAAGISSHKYTGERYNDTDVFKIIEGAANSLMNAPDENLEEYVDSLIVIIEAAQEDDGYLYTARSTDPKNPAPGAGRDRWIDIWVSHELYNAGHLYEAAVAYFKATGKRSLLDVAIKNADLVCDVFEWGKREAAPGHQEIEIGLIKLFEVTGEEKYLEQARFFLDVRGKPQDHLEHPEGTRFAIYNNKTYLQQHFPVLEQTEAVGHAVRATYMYTAMTNLARHSSDCIAYHKKSEEIWEDVVRKKLYITGGVGAVGDGESFGEAFFLPNEEAYNETCAAIGNVLWNQSLFQSTGEAKYYDVLERSLYNGLISGVSQDGKKFFYPNPLSSDGRYTRSPWFGVACCPGNICRFMPLIPEMIYAYSEDKIYVNLFVGSEAKVSFDDKEINLRQTTGYPWNGKVELIIDPETSTHFALCVRIPSWLGKSPFYGELYSYKDSIQYRATIALNNKKIDYEIENGYAIINRKWVKGDKLAVEFPMPVRKVISNNMVEENRGHIAIERGPLVYCLEEIDNGKLNDILLHSDIKTSTKYDSKLFNGVVKVQIDNAGKKLSAIPYYLWSNRNVGEMKVWLPIIDNQ